VQNLSFIRALAEYMLNLDISFHSNYRRTLRKSKPLSEKSVFRLCKF